MSAECLFPVYDKMIEYSIINLTYVENPMTRKLIIPEYTTEPLSRLVSHCFYFEFKPHLYGFKLQNM